MEIALRSIFTIVSTTYDCVFLFKFQEQKTLFL